MIALILFVLVGALFAYFATLNTALVTLYLGAYVTPQIPLYLVVLFSLGIGLVIGSLTYLVKSLFVHFSLSKRDQGLKEARQEITELTRKIHVLELENTKLKTRMGEETIDDDSL